MTELWRWSRLVVGTWMLLCGPVPLSAAAPETVEDSASYFPDEIGNWWSYQGSITEGPLQTIERKLFVNESKVVRTETQQHVQVKVFHDTNGGNHGPSTSYYRRDAVGIVYYGSDPGTPLEKQLVPYQIMQFPLRPSVTFQQFDRKKLDFGTDLDQDGINEQVDVLGTVSVIGKEPVSVPAGKYDEAMRVEARMTLRITLSTTKKTAVGTDIMNAWFVKGIGLVKYVEEQELPPVSTDRGLTSEISEELVDFKVAPRAQSFEGSEAPAQRVLTRDTSRQKL